MKTTAVGLLVLLAILYAPSLQAQNRLFVDIDAQGADDGSTWQDAFRHLQDALRIAQSGDEIWVADGVYRPDLGVDITRGDRSVSFDLQSGVRLHGGFSGNETSVAERRLSATRTILTGDLLGDDQAGLTTRDDNSYHVMTIYDADSATLVEGVFVAGGHANGTERDSVGAGMLISAGSPRIVNVAMLANRAAAGGGVYVDTGTPLFANAVFSGNAATWGGAVFNNSANTEFVNVTISGNTATLGAGIYNHDSSPAISNSVIFRNGVEVAVADCERFNYPCTFSEVAPDVIQASIDLAIEARQRLKSDSISVVAQWIRDRSEVADVLADGTAIRFRLVGGRPTWVIRDELTTSRNKTENSTPSELAGPRRSDQAHQGLTASNGIRDAVGKDTNMDGKVNNRDDKKALVLSPFEWQFGEYDEGQQIADILRETRGYEGNVEFLTNQQADVAAFKTWSKYDVVYVSTHGSRLCYVGEADRECTGPLSIDTGERVDVEELTASIEPGLDISVYEDATSTQTIPRVVLGLEVEFFEHYYPSGLEKALVFMSSCETGDALRDTELTFPTLAGALISSTTHYFGWTQSVATDLASATGRDFIRRMSEDGVNTSVARRETKKVPFESGQLGSGVDNEGRFTELIGWGYPSTKLHIREIVAPLAVNGAILPDGATIDHMLRGTLDDSSPDDLSIPVLVEGLEQQDVEQAKIRFELDGQPIGSATLLTDVDAIVPVGEFSWAIEHRVPAGKDLTSDQRYQLEAILEFAEDGDSRHEAENLRFEPCFWKLSIGGSRSGEYSGSSAWFGQKAAGFAFQFNPDDFDDPISVIDTQLLFVPPDKVGSYSLAANGNGDGYGTISFNAVEPPVLYFTGDGSEIVDQDNNVIFVLPQPSSLEITSDTGDQIEGRISGVYWTQISFIPAVYAEAPVSIEFRAKLGFNGPETFPDACEG